MTGWQVVDECTLRIHAESLCIGLPVHTQRTALHVLVHMQRPPLRGIGRGGERGERGFVSVGIDEHGIYEVCPVIGKAVAIVAHDNLQLLCSLHVGFKRSTLGPGARDES